MTLTEMLDNMADANAKFRPQARAEWADAVMLELMEVFTPERLAEVFAAEREGRCVVLPCKIGTKLYEVIYRDGKPSYVLEYQFGWHTYSATIDGMNKGVTHFTSAEAEAALRQKGATDEQL